MLSCHHFQAPSFPLKASAPIAKHAAIQITSSLAGAADAACQIVWFLQHCDSCQRCAVDEHPNAVHRRDISKRRHQLWCLDNGLKRNRQLAEKHVRYTFHFVSNGFRETYVFEGTSFRSFYR